MNREELIENITKLKNELKDQIVIPAHHYQDYDIVKFGDFIGDSYKLAVECSKVKNKFIIFCGVLFMAETARILCSNEQIVLIPDKLAGCPMACMADMDTISKTYNHLTELSSKPIAPVVYMNSYADLKSFCGEHNGSVCTSSNAAKILDYYFGKGQPILFFPDYYLGINTAKSMGIKDEEIIKVKRNLNNDINGDIKNAKIFLWDGYCPVHKKFSQSDIIHLKEKYPSIKIIVHPECSEEVANSADMTGSTEKIYKVVKDSPTGSIWGIGTETTFVDRIAKENPDKTIIAIRESKCVNMVKITLQKLYDTLKAVKNFDKKISSKYEVTVDETFKENAKKSLQKMIEIAG
jgi:quinolinate synthase